MFEMPFADAKLHTQLAAKRLRNGTFADRFLNRGVRFYVGVSGGLLDGLSSKFHTNTCHVGSSFESDIVLFDDGVDEKHVEMNFKSSIFGPVLRVRAISAGVRVAGENLARGKASKYQTLPTEISINGTTLEVRPQIHKARAFDPVIVQAWHYCRYPVLSLMILMGLVHLVSNSNFDFEVAMSNDETPYDIVQLRDVEMKRLEVATSSVQSKLAELGLAEYLNATMDASGAVGLSGTLRAEKQGAWNTFRHWYDENEPSVLLSSVTMAPNLSDFPAISSVKLNAPQVVKLQNGAQIGIGDMIYNRLRLKEVSNGYLVLDDNGEDLIISFNGEEMNDG
jgi:hypothetical protein